MKEPPPSSKLKDRLFQFLITGEETSALRKENYGVLRASQEKLHLPLVGDGAAATAERLNKNPDAEPQKAQIHGGLGS